MPLQYDKAAGDVWAATVQFARPRAANDVGVTITVGGSGGEPDAVSLRIAENLGATLSDVHEQAVQYLNQFVDRERIASGANWWLDEIEIQRARLGHPICRFRFALQGDGVAVWNVDMLCEAAWLRPYRIERYDGFAQAHLA
jgi:hypothetical protein